MGAENQIELRPAQAKTLVEFLSAQESLLKRISSYDNEDTKQAFNRVYQAAQVCHVTSKQIRAWIRKGKLEALNLPGLGIIIEAGKLNEFSYQIRPIQNSPTPERSHEP